MSEPVREGTMEKCYFCGINYIEQWPVEVLASTICPGCMTMPTGDLMGKYPEKFEELFGNSCKVYRCASEDYEE